MGHRDRFGWRRTVVVAMICAWSVVPAAAGQPTETVLRWGQASGEVRLLEVPDGRFGPQALATCGEGETLVLDSIGGRLLWLDEALTVARGIDLGLTPLDVAASADCGFVVRSADLLRRYQPDGAVMAEATLPPEVRFVSRLGLQEDGQITLEEGFSRTYELDTAEGWGIASVSPGARMGSQRVQAEVVDGRWARLLYFRPDGAHERTLDVEVGGPELASVRLVAADAWGRLVLDIERLVSSSPVEVRRTLMGVAEDGSREWSLELPGTPYALAARDVVLTSDGAGLVAMIGAPDGLHVLRWALAPGSAGETVLQLPAALMSEPPPLAFEPEPYDQAPVSGTAAGPPITREQVLAKADTYVRHAWTASSCNIGTRDCGSKMSTSPSWVTAGPKTQVAYKWGGFSTLAEYDAGLASCKLAGDRVTEDGGASCAVGVDCSGFVSRCWNTTSKYGTATIHQVSYEIGASEMLPGDVFNKSGSHVRMLVSKNPNGTLNMVESYAGSNYWRVGYTVRTYSDNSSYVARRYANIDEGSGPRPGSAENPISVKSASFVDSNTTAGGPSDRIDRYSCATQTDESGPELFYKLELSLPATVTVAVSDGSAVDVDPHLLSGLDGTRCLARNDVSLTVQGLAAGDYYIAADTWVNSSGHELAGAYQLTVKVDPPQALASDTSEPAVAVLDQGTSLQQTP